MEWIWVIILLFSVFSNLMEKMAKERQRTESKGNNRGEELATPPVKPTESLPRMEPELAPVWQEKLPEWNQSFTPKQDLKGDGLIDILAEEDWEFPTSDNWQESEESGEILAHQLLDAFVLAHALSRPDFRTIPWQRRL